MNSKEIKFCQLNLNRRILATLDLDNRPEDIYLLQEPNIGKKGPIIKHKRGWFALQNARAAVYIRQPGLDSILLSKFSTPDLVSVEIKSLGMIVCSGYFDSCQGIPQELKELCSYCSTKNYKLLIGIDSNAHSGMWGCTDENRGGELVEDFIVNYNLNLHNVGSVPIFERKMNN